MTTKSKKQAAAPAPPPGIHGSAPCSLISDDKLLALYTALLKCRMMKKRAANLLKQNRLSRANSSGLSQEASAVGVAIDLLPGDTLTLCDDGGFIVSFVKGAPLGRLFASHRARAAGQVRRVSCAARLQTALRAARANKAGKNQKIAVAFRNGFSAESPARPALWLRAMRRAGAERLPVLFVCHTHGDSEDPSWKTQDLPLPGIIVDGNDVVAIYRVTSEAIAHARRGNGPTLIECRTLLPSGPQKNRGREAADPIRNMEDYLIRKGLFTAKFKAEAAAEAGRWRYGPCFTLERRANFLTGAVSGAST